jgi:hypothetical protein
MLRGKKVIPTVWTATSDAIASLKEKGNKVTHPVTNILSTRALPCSKLDNGYFLLSKKSFLIIEGIGGRILASSNLVFTNSVI